MCVSDHPSSGPDWFWTGCPRLCGEWLSCLCSEKTVFLESRNDGPCNCKACVVKNRKGWIPLYCNTSCHLYICPSPYFCAIDLCVHPSVSQTGPDRTVMLYMCAIRFICVCMCLYPSLRPDRAVTVGCMFIPVVILFKASVIGESFHPSYQNGPFDPRIRPPIRAGPDPGTCAMDSTGLWMYGADSCRPCERITATFVDANHSSGSVMVVFEGLMGRW